MILDNPLAGESLRTLPSFTPQPDLAPMCHLDDRKCTLSDEPARKPEVQPLPGAAAVTAIFTAKINVVEEVRLFGGVIIGSAALEISKSFGGFRQHAMHEEVESEQDDVERKLLVASFNSSTSTTGARPSTTSPVFQDKGELSYEGARKAECADCGTSAVVSPAETIGLLSASQPPVVLTKKRKVAWSAADPRNRSSVAGDAVPHAPLAGGRAAARAKAEGQDGTSFVSECQLPTDKGQFRLRAYRFAGKDKSHEPVVMVAGDVRGKADVPVRVHDQCQTSEVLGSKRCDCREQLDLSLRYIQENGGGAVIYLQQEGRGIGLANKVAAYALQDGGLDTVDANRRLGFKDDQRSYECVDFILRDMDVKSVHLMTNNPFKIEWLKSTGVEVTGRIPLEVASNKHNVGYLEAKASRMSHLINNL